MLLEGDWVPWVDGNQVEKAEWKVRSETYSVLYQEEVFLVKLSGCFNRNV